MKNLAFKIRRLREIRNLTQEYIADQLEVSVKTYQRFESGRATLSLERGIKLVSILGVNLDDIVQPDSDEDDISNTNQRVEVLLLKRMNALLTDQLNKIQHEKEHLLDIIANLSQKGNQRSNLEE